MKENKKERIIEIMKKAGKIENTYILIEKPTKNEYGTTIKITGDPSLKIMHIDNEGRDSNEIKISDKKYYIEHSIFIDIDKIPKFIDGINTLMDMEL